MYFLCHKPVQLLLANEEINAKTLVTGIWFSDFRPTCRCSYPVPGLCSSQLVRSLSPSGSRDEAMSRTCTPDHMRTTIYHKAEPLLQICQGHRVQLVNAWQTIREIVCFTVAIAYPRPIFARAAETNLVMVSKED
ncbi:unnamed protein product [Protopolystoma xenopodis]|uniref:Uncharacterized protein n=1 Tax=Protopolystoma xenopodis TaxID=117903 RepID=A0A448WBW9_9PLAT|nr:unnamed protein product [Protopolystoma xenopodis]